MPIIYFLILQLSNRVSHVLLVCTVFLLSVNVAAASSLNETLKENFATLSVRINQYDKERYNQLLAKSSVQLIENSAELGFQGSRWQVSKQVTPLEKTGKYKVTVTFKCLSGEVPNASVSVDLDFANWSRTNYVLLPAAAYNGNRYEAVRMDYMPFFTEPQILKAKNTPIVLSDVPRLNVWEGYSRVQDRSGSTTIPGIGYYSPSGKRGMWVCTTQGNRLGDYGFDVEEGRHRDKAVATITSPVVREQEKYINCRMDRYPSTDEPANFKAGDVVEISLILDLFTGESVQSLYDELVDIRTKHYPVADQKDIMPFSKAFSVIEAHKNLECWRKEGYYAGAPGNNTWVPGWVDGTNLLFSLMAQGENLSMDRAMQTVNWVYPAGISPSGFYYDKWFNDRFAGVKPQQPLMSDITLTRKNADAIYYAFKLFDMMKRQGKKVDAVWVESNLKAIQAQARAWKKEGQMGQWVNQTTGEIVVGNSTSAGIFPAALCAASKYTGEQSYLLLAKEIGQYYYDHYVSKGLIYGGPGDAMQCFDSESSYGLVESYVELYENTRDERWLTYAKEAANQFSTWVVGYDYQFPEHSAYHKLQMQTVGTVYANVQNKHTSAGICTHSGIALLKLYRATGNVFYMNQLRDIAHAIPQYMSSAERPIPGMHDGWISERINTTDWQDRPQIGEVLVSSNWNEVTMLLTAAELPGVYVNKTTKEVFVLDHVEASLNKKGQLEITNPTKYDAVVKILAETSGQMAKPLGQNAFLNWKKVQIPAGKTLKVTD